MINKCSSVDMNILIMNILSLNIQIINILSLSNLIIKLTNTLIAQL